MLYERLVSNKVKLHKDVSLSLLLEVGYALAADHEAAYRRIGGEVLGCTVALSDGGALKVYFDDFYHLIFMFFRCENARKSDFYYVITMHSFRM